MGKGAEIVNKLKNTAFIIAAVCFLMLFPIEQIQADTFGNELGYYIGEIYGKMDFYAGKNCDWGNQVPAAKELTEIFDLNKEPKSIKEDFLSSFRASFKKGYEFGYRYAKYEPTVLTFEQGREDGDFLGGLLGANRGSRDYYSGTISDWGKNMPSDEKIKYLFLLGNDSQYYCDAFIAAFKTAYQIKYEWAYRKANVDRTAGLYGDGYSNGWDLGMEKGAGLAVADRMMNLSCDENRYKVTEKDVIADYVLNSENERYREGFVNGYLGGIKEGYMTSYRQYDFTQAMKRSSSNQVPISGMNIESGDGRLRMSIEKGTYYNDILVNIDAYTEGNTGIEVPSPKNTIKASGVYTVTIANRSGAVNRDRTIKLNIEYYGPETAGIYVFRDKEWVYLPSKLEATGISTLLIPKAAVKSTAIYGVFIDENARNPYDLRGHWAKDEVTAYLRRGILDYPSDNYFSPDAPLSYNQAAAWLNKVWGSELENPADKNKPLTYTEFERLFRQASGKNGFTWSYIAGKMAQNKDKRSGSYSSMKGYITRAEAIYALYYELH